MDDQRSALPYPIAIHRLMGKFQAPVFRLDDESADLWIRCATRGAATALKGPLAALGARGFYGCGSTFPRKQSVVEE
jgi:hypothetical protein